MESLRAGGVTTTAKDFYTTVYTAIRRLADASEVVNIGKEWGLAEWYPGRARTLQRKEQTPDSQSAAGEVRPTADDGNGGSPALKAL